MVKMKHCIYKIENKINGKVYIGQTVNFNKRTREHINTERTATGKAISKHGKESFDFEIIHNEIDSEKINEWEKHYINQVYNSFEGKGYNCTPGGKKLFGEDNPFYNKKHTAETKNKLKKLNSGINSPWFGRKHTQKTKHKIRKTHSKLTKAEYKKIYYDYKNNDINQRELANKYNLGLGTIGRIVKAEHWATKELTRIKKEVDTAHRGEEHPKSKYSNKKYKEIFYEYQNTNLSYRDLAKKYNLDKSTIGRIVRQEHSATKDLA